MAHPSKSMDIDGIVAEIVADLKANRLKLPTLPQAALKVSHVVDSPDASAKKVARIVGADAALSARLIQAANSPLLRGNAAVENVQAAVARMGMKTVRNLTTAFLIRQMFRSRHATLKQRLSHIWSHSVHVAAISYVLALRFTDLKAEEAMLAGLVHDIGKLPIVAKAEDHPELVHDPETLDELSARLHPTLGKLILQTWHFAPEFVRVAAEHDNLQRRSETLDLTDIVTVANLHSYTGNGKVARNPHKNADWSTVPAFHKLGLDPLGSIDILKEARDEIGEIQRLLTS